MLRIGGDADERVTDTDAFFRAWHPMLRPLPLVPEAERTARACEEWTREVMRRLEGERFNVITLKWFGRPRAVPSFLERHGVTGAFAADSAFLRGLGLALGLDPVVAPETDDPVSDLRARVELARKALADTVVRAPFAGAVAQRFVSVGDYVNKGTKVAQVVRNNPLRAQLTVTPS